MGNLFPKLEKGQAPTRQHFNRINDASSKFIHMFDRHGISKLNGMPDSFQFIFEVTNTKITDDDEEDSGLYLGKIIWFSHNAGEWDDDETKEWVIDANWGEQPLQLSVGNRIIVYWDEQRGTFIPISSVSPLPIELMLAEDHPGRGEVFKAYVGTWCPNSNNWTYNCGDECAEWIWAVDHRFDVPYPNAGARGLFIARTSTFHGIIYENISMDCSSPGTCQEQYDDGDFECAEEAETNYVGACEAVDQSDDEVSDNSSGQA